MEENQAVFYDWPNGRRSVAGGTRISIKLDRPWQVPVKVPTDPANCPFCDGKKKTLKHFDEEGGWRLVENAFTMYRVNGGVHDMLIPDACWPVEKLWDLGGEKSLAAAFRIIQEEVENHKERILFINFHIGYQAGQNVPHLHFHIVQYLFDAHPLEPMPGLHAAYENEYKHLILSEDERWIFGIGGAKAGQCFMLPKARNTLPELAGNLHAMVSLYNRKFKSVQGLMPDFNVSVVMVDGRVLHGLYTPILNNWGAAESLVGYYSGAPMSLPWAHEKTVEYLRS